MAHPGVTNIVKARAAITNSRRQKQAQRRRQIALAWREGVRTTPELAERFGVSRKTINDDLKTLGLRTIHYQRKHGKAQRQAEIEWRIRRGERPTEIARAMGITYVSVWKLRKGVAEQTPTTAMGARARRDKTIREMRANGLTVTEICRRMKVSSFVVYGVSDPPERLGGFAAEWDRYPTLAAACAEFGITIEEGRRLLRQSFRGDRDKEETA